MCDEMFSPAKKFVGLHLDKLLVLCNPNGILRIRVQQVERIIHERLKLGISEYIVSTQVFDGLLDSGCLGAQPRWIGTLKATGLARLG